MNPKIIKEEPKIILCKYCGTVLDPKKAFKHKKIGLNGEITIWQFCNISEVIPYLNVRSHKNKVILKPNTNKPTMET